MKKNKLNIVFIGQQTFPEGTATTKRRRYIIDYLNSKNISTRVLITFYHNTLYKNPQKGLYGEAYFESIHEYATDRDFVRYYKEGKKLLREWFKSGYKNFLIFPTVLTAFDFPFYRFAKKLGYKIIFDQVETSYLKSGKLKVLTRLYYWLNEQFSKIAYKSSASFVISSGLLTQNRVRYPQMPLAILPNSTPVLCKQEKVRINDELQILYSGTYGEKEGVKFLIEGVLKAVKAGYSCKLILLGKAPSALKDSYEMERCIDFRGFVSEEELKDSLLNADVLAMVRTNSIFAKFGFPFKLSEYLATGGIVISTNVGDVSKYLTDKVDAYLIEPENINAICNVIIHIKKNPDESLKIAKNGLNTMKEKFSIDVVGRQFIDFVNEL